MQNSAISILLEHLDSGVLFLDAAQEVITVNGYLSFLLGTGNEPVSTENAVQLLNSLFSGVASFPSAEEVMLTRKYRIGEDLDLPDGRTIEVNYIPVIENNSLYGHLWLLREATYRKFMENKLVEEKLKSEKYIRMHGNYLRAATGGINSSLNSILGLSLLLRQLDVDNSVREFTEAIKSTAEGAAALSKSLSPDLFVRINDGRIRQKYYLHSTFEKLCGVFSSILASEGRLIDFNASGFDEQTIVFADAERLNGVVSILLAQMLETPGASDISFDAMLTHTQLTIQVSTAVSKEANERIPGFEENTTLNEAFRLAELLSGKLTDSEEDGIRKLILTLEVERSPQGKITKEFNREDIVIDQLKGVRLLAIASHEENRLWLQGYLSAWGAEFLISFPEEAGNSSASFTPQVILFDFDSADSQAVRLQESFSSIPAVFLVASDDEKRNFQAGMNRKCRILAKPFYPEELCSAISELAKPERRITPAPESAVAHEAEQNELQVFDLSRLKQTAVGNPQVVKTILRECIDVVPGLIDELEAAVSDLNTRRVHFLAQQLSTYFGYLGMSEAVNLVKQLERFAFSSKDSGERGVIIAHLKKLFRFVLPKLKAELNRL